MFISSSISVSPILSIKANFIKLFEFLGRKKHILKCYAYLTQSEIFFFNKCSWVSFIPLTPSKRTYHLHILNLPSLQKPGMHHVIKDLGILDSKNKLQTISLIGVQGHCEFIYTPSCGKLF